MTRQDGRRLAPSVFGIDPRMRAGHFSDQYFLNAVQILSQLAAEGYRFAGSAPRLPAGASGEGVDVGNIEVEMQCFTRRRLFAVACGVDHAVAILKECAGFFDERGRFHGKFDRLEVEAVHDGDRLEPWAPALRIRGRYRDFAILETPTLGVLARSTRIATNTYEALRAGAGTPVFMFGPRFDIPAAQACDGYAYKVGVERFNAETGGDVPAMITTAEQGRYWNARGSGTTSHSLMLCFLSDTTEAMLHFARILPVEVSRIALVDTNNDCVGDSVRCALAFFRRWREHHAAGRSEEARRYILAGVRCDTPGEQRDVSVEPTGDSRMDNGVVPRLVVKVREALDSLHTHSQVPPAARAEAREYFGRIKIVASGGFNPERIEWFRREKAPVDVFGIGSFLEDGPAADFTADVVCVKLHGRWVKMAKVGRKPVANPDLQRVT